MAKKSAKTSGAGVPVGALAEAAGFVGRFAASDKATVEGGSPLLHFAGERVSAYSGVTAATHVLPRALGDFAAPADRFTTACAAVSAQGVAEIELTLSENSLSWRGGSARGRIALAVTDGSAFPEQPGAYADVDQDFWLAVQRAAAVVGKNDQWPMLRGVYWGADCVMASDGDRLVRVAIPTEYGSSVLIPDHLLRAVRGERPSHAARAENVVWFRSERWVAGGLLLQHEFPAERLAQVFGAFSERASAGERCRVVVKEGQPTRALLKSVGDAAAPPLRAVRVAVGKRAVEVSCEESGGDASVVIAADVEGGPAECRINAQYLAELFEQGIPLYFGEQAVYAADDERRLQYAAMCFAG